MDIEVKNELLKITSDKIPKINDIVDVLENFDLSILSINTSKNSIKLKLDKPITENLEVFKKIVKHSLLGNIKKDCKLYYFYWLGFNLRKIEYLRALGIYQSQIMKFSYEFIINTYIKYAKDITGILDKKEAKIDASNVSEERVLKIFQQIVSNILKTNFPLNKETISFKINVRNFKHLLKGVNPNIEAFIYHRDFSGVHLRMSKIARGGIRHSERVDFREEIKDLMTTQQYKNAIIVPNGAKGGFYINAPFTKEDVKKYYTLFIDALLDLVDEDDFYLVVAADKGTSDFSDIANEIAQKKNYPFKDAFASGGKYGYSHKKLGITARGALESANVHFKEINKDIFKDEISVVGVGSMRGDVFGNGMLFNKNFKLIAAISSREIFIDPNPDIKKAYLERKRLFEKGLGWKSYDKNAISKGGGVFLRKEKTQKISKEIQELINYDKDTIETDELVRRLLTLKVDLLYFGGIGTYVKASDEINELISDKTNAQIRVNASDLNAYAVCEGANLALTNKARVEYSKKGKINLDAIDNSAGVNISDYEVNLKLAGISRKKLLEITDEVIKKVLVQNRLQPLRITQDLQYVSKKDISEISKLLSSLDTFKEVFASFGSKEPLRPVLAILLLYSKIYIKSKIDFYDEKAYLQYFPKEFKPQTHPLQKEISKTVLANKLLNVYGLKLMKNFSMQKVFTLLNLIKVLNLEKIRNEIFKLNDFKKQLRLLNLIDEIIDINIDTVFENTPVLIASLDELVRNQNKLKFVGLFLKISQETSTDIEEIKRIYSKINATVKLEKLLNHIRRIKTATTLEEEIKLQIYKNIELFLYNTIVHSITNSLHPRDFVKKEEFEKEGSICYYHYISNRLLINSLSY